MLKRRVGVWLRVEARVCASSDEVRLDARCLNSAVMCGPSLRPPPSLESPSLPLKLSVSPSSFADCGVTARAICAGGIACVLADVCVLAAGGECEYGVCSYS